MVVQMAGRMEAMMDSVYNGVKKTSESGIGRTLSDAETGYGEGEQDGAYRQQVEMQNKLNKFSSAAPGELSCRCIQLKHHVHDD